MNETEKIDYDLFASGEDVTNNDADCGEMNFDQGENLGIPKKSGIKCNVPHVEGVVLNDTQTCVDEEIEKHFEEDEYLKGFSMNLKELGEVYAKCVTNFEVSFALYPHNARLAELKKEYSHFFNLFAETSPISKKLSLRNMVEKAGKKAVIKEDSHFIPSYSLGLTQMTPKNLGTDMDGCASLCMKRREKCSSSQTVARNLVEQKMNEKDKSKGVIDNRDENNVMLRPRRGIKVTQICRSPFVSRIVDISGHTIIGEEKHVWDWLFQNKRNKKEDLFVWNSKMCTKGHFQSLQDNKMLESTVIDTWTYLLNEHEILRSDASPLRLFLTTETCYGPLKMVIGEDDVQGKLKRNAVFHDNMDHVFDMVIGLHNRDYDVKEFDMFVFPIYDATHFYVICYNMKKPRLDIIDNRVQTDTFENMYGDLPFRLHECFYDWISIYNLPKEKEIKNLKPRVVRMGWQTMDNFVDCGIFAMRHMETYMGNLYTWKVGLRAQNENQKALLNKLRVIYCHKLLTWNCNEKKGMVLNGAASLGKEKKVGG